MRKYGSFHIMAILYFINWIDAAETIEGGKLYKGGKYLRKYGNVNFPSEIISTQCASLRPLVQVKEFDINFDDHWHDEILHELHNKKPLKLTQDHKSSQVKISPTDCKLNLMPGMLTG